MKKLLITTLIGLLFAIPTTVSAQKGDYTSITSLIFNSGATEQKIFSYYSPYSDSWLKDASITCEADVYSKATFKDNSGNTLGSATFEDQDNGTYKAAITNSNTDTTDIGHHIYVFADVKEVLPQQVNIVPCTFKVNQVAPAPGNILLPNERTSYTIVKNADVEFTKAPLTTKINELTKNEISFESTSELIHSTTVTYHIDGQINDIYFKCNAFATSNYDLEGLQSTLSEKGGAILFSDVNKAITAETPITLNLRADTGENTSSFMKSTGACYIAAIDFTPTDEAIAVNPNMPSSYITEYTLFYILDDYEDLTESHPNYEAIMALTRDGTLKGYEGGLFKPNADVNRAELTKMLNGQNGMFYYSVTESCFPDLETGEWYYRFVCNAFKAGWIDGYPDGTFKPAQPVNRIEAIKMVLLARDINVNMHEPEGQEWYSIYIPSAKEIGLLYNDPNLERLNENVSRAELAEMQYRAMNWKTENIYKEFVDASPELVQKVNDFYEKNVDKEQISSADLRITCSNEIFSEYEEILAELDTATLYTGEWTYNNKNYQTFIKNHLLLFTLLRNQMEPLHIAVNSGCVELTQQYLTNGSDINDATGYAGKAPLHIAVDNQDIEMVNFLIEQGANLNEPTTNQAYKIDMALSPYAPATYAHAVPLTFAIGNQDLEIAKILLEAGANPNYTIPELDAESQPYSGYIILDDGYSYISIKGGNSLLDIALETKNLDMIDLLREYGATQEQESDDEATTEPTENSEETAEETTEEDTTTSEEAMTEEEPETETM